MNLIESCIDYLTFDLIVVFDQLKKNKLPKKTLQNIYV